MKSGSWHKCIQWLDLFYWLTLCCLWGSSVLTSATTRNEVQKERGGETEFNCVTGKMLFQPSPEILLLFQESEKESKLHCFLEQEWPSILFFCVNILIHYRQLFYIQQFPFLLQRCQVMCIYTDTLACFVFFLHHFSWLFLVSEGAWMRYCFWLGKTEFCCGEYKSCHAAENSYPSGIQRGWSAMARGEQK